MKELTLKEIQGGSFKILGVFKNFCEKNNLVYYLAYGTLIGAIRHKGFIPWDDDIDVFMPRPDYEKMISLFLDSPAMFAGLRLFHFRTAKKYPYVLARLTDTNFWLDYSNVKNYGIGLFIDIYPLDGVNEKTIKKIQNWSYILALHNSLKFPKSSKPLINFFKFPVFLLSKFFSTYYLTKKIDRIASRQPFELSEFVGCPAWCDYRLYRREWFGNGVKKDFNDQLFVVPSDFDAVLRLEYGDYLVLPPENQRIGHHFYKAYRKINL